VGLVPLRSMAGNDDDGAERRRKVLEDLLVMGWWFDAFEEKAREDGGGGIGDQAADRMADATMEARMEAEQEEARLERYPEGLIIVDSMAFVRNHSGPHDYGPEELSLKLAQEYNIKARVIALGGLRFTPARGRRSYHDVLQWGISDAGAAKPEFVVVVSGGNDVYGAPDSQELYDAVGRLAEKLRILRVPSLVVFGGSSKTWKYRGSFGKEYDARVRRVLAEGTQRMLPIQRGGFCRIVSGEKELRSIKDEDLCDRIGHLEGSKAFDKLASAMAKWVSMCSGPPGRSRL
jgi:hypothetical protein